MSDTITQALALLSASDYRVVTESYGRGDRECWLATVETRRRSGFVWTIMRMTRACATEGEARDRAERWLADFKVNWSWTQATGKEEKRRA